MTYKEWNKLDRKAIATICQYLEKNLYFNVSGENMTDGLWKKLHDLYEKNMALVVDNLNEFNKITNQLASIKIILDDEIRDILLMCSMPDSWENLIVAMRT